uniref:Ig-like domain-containing protein n=1 Tax=Xiphophorus couchianus TaxID=32473 RepID=A0A3B5M6T1_9TELE
MLFLWTSIVSPAIISFYRITCMQLTFHLTFQVGHSALFPALIIHVVETQHTRIAQVGEDAQLSCWFLGSNGVQEVIWEKLSGSTMHGVGSYNLLSGAKVFPPFKDKVQFAYSGLKNSSIIVKNVTEQDVGCYLCLFTSYPFRNLTAETWSLVTCSATGQPAPTVTLTVSHMVYYSHYNPSSKTNTNGTITITTTALLSAVNSTLVRCSVEVDKTVEKSKKVLNIMRCLRGKLMLIQLKTKIIKYSSILYWCRIKIVKPVKNVKRNSCVLLLAFKYKRSEKKRVFELKHTL